MKIIHTKNAPAPGGHYSQGISAAGLLFISGQLPITPDGGKLSGAPIEEQVNQCLSNILAIVKSAGGSKESIAKITVYVADMDLWPRVDKTYAEFFGAHKPARAVVPTAPLHFGFLVEAEAIAAIDS
jgi:2-iminobutanoate/2-iminopropanoate deaminase